MKSKYLIGALILMISSIATAQPSELIIDKQMRPSVSAKKIANVHKEVVVSNKNLAAIKYAILDGMLQTKGYKWLFEGEGDGYILARFDYRGDTNIMRIEYSKEMVQLKYHDAWGDFVCKNLIDGICYKNAGGYYKYVRNLRNSIAKHVTTI